MLQNTVKDSGGIALMGTECSGAELSAEKRKERVGGIICF